ncbi:hypothetical protein NADE_008707 [Nannochloris sp. 'desiccata']|nr:hypothetical protein NADE_008707 [Chlorella desiccata (nom. nud.)]
MASRPRATLVLTDPPVGLYRDAAPASYPVITVSVRPRYDLERKHQAALFSRAVDKSIHSHFPQDSPQSPETSLIEHAPCFLESGYMRVSFAVKNLAVVDKLIADNMGTGTLPLPAEIEGGVTFEDARIYWTNYAVPYTRELLYVPANIDPAKLISFISSEKCTCTLVNQVSGASALSGRYLVQFLVSSVNDIPSNIQIPDPDGSATHIIQVRVPSDIPTATAIDQELKTLKPALVPFNAWKTKIVQSKTPTSSPAATGTGAGKSAQGVRGGTGVAGHSGVVEKNPK